MGELKAGCGDALHGVCAMGIMAKAPLAGRSKTRTATEARRLVAAVGQQPVAGA